MIDGLKLHVPNQLMDSFNKKELVSIGNNGFRLREHELGYIKERLLFTTTEKGLTIEGSVRYAINNNSFVSVDNETVNGYFSSLSDRIGIDLFKGTVRNFEAGTVVETPFAYDEFIFNHVGVPNMLLTNNKKYSRVYADALRCLKFYDAKERLKQMVSLADRYALMEEGIYDKNKNYIKYELKYLKPTEYFKINSLSLGKLLDDEFNHNITNDLINTYKTVNKTGFEVKAKGSDLDVPTLLYATLKKVEKEVGNIDVNEMLMNSLHVYSDRFSADGKSKRKKNLKNLFNKLKSDVNPTDITQLLTEKLKT